MYNLYRHVAGKKTLMITDTYKKVKAREKQLKSGSRQSKASCNKITFSIEDAEVDQEKYKKTPHTQWANYDYPKIKRAK